MHMSSDYVCDQPTFLNKHATTIRDEEWMADFMKSSRVARSLSAAAVLVLAFTAVGCSSAQETTLISRPGMEVVYNVESTGAAQISQKIRIGPYQSSAFGPYSAARLAGKEAQSGIQQVSFMEDRLISEFSLQTPTGQSADVQIGVQETGETIKTLGIWTSPKPGPISGVVTEGGRPLGYFRLIEPIGPFTSAATPTAGEGILSGEIVTPVGTVSHYTRIEPTPGRGAIGKFFLGAGPIHSAYDLDGRTVARRDSNGVYFHQDLPSDARTCIAAEMVWRVSSENHQLAAQSQVLMGPAK